MAWDGQERRKTMKDDIMTRDDCERCDVRTTVFGKDGLKDSMKEIREDYHSIDKRLSRIEAIALGIAAAYVFFSQILPVLLKWGQAAARTP
jgi:hypothetical protein